jgi:NTE family protein
VLGLRDHYYKGITTLSRSDLPDHPRFIFCATEITHGVDFIFEKDRAGSNERKRFDDGAGGRDVARAVAASSCFPPVFQPLPLRLQPQSPLRALGGAVGSERTAQNPERLEVSDGGVYDNLGIEPIWRNSRVILVSDGGAPFRTAPDHGFLWRLQRWADIGGHAAGSLRKRWLISNYITGGLTGTYWGIDSAAGNYPDGQSGYSPSLVDQRIAAIRTDLDAFSDVEAQAVQNHGYSLADAAVRSHVPELITLDCGFTWPYPERSPEHSPALWTALRRSNKRGLLGHEPLSRLPAKLFDG